MHTLVVDSLDQVDGDALQSEFNVAVVDEANPMIAAYKTPACLWRLSLGFQIGALRFRVRLGPSEGYFEPSDLIRQRIHLTFSLLR